MPNLIEKPFEGFCPTTAVECEKNRDYLTLFFFFSNRKWFPWTHPHFSKNAKCARSMRENGRRPGRILSQSPLLLVSGSGSRPSSLSLAHFATENIKKLFDWIQIPPKMTHKYRLRTHR